MDSERYMQGGLNIHKTGESYITYIVKIAMLSLIYVCYVCLIRIKSPIGIVVNSLKGRHRIV